MNDTQRKIAFFPLNVFLLPGEDLPLRIFEPRYKQLIDDCEKYSLTFGIPYMKQGQMQSFGTEVRINQIIARNSQGEMVIMVEGVSNFEMISFQEKMSGKLYAAGKIKELKNDREIGDNELVRMVIHYSEHLDHDFLKKVKGNAINLSDIAVALNLSSNDKYRYISLLNLDERERFLRAQMSILLKLREQEEMLRNDYYLN